MRIVLDGMGGDNAPAEIVKGASLASKIINHEICIIGDEEKIKAELDKNDHDANRISIIHASDVITNEDKPVKAIRGKKDSSLVKGLNLVKNGEADMIISAGNSGAIMTGGLLLLGRLKGIERPALASPYPMIGKGGGGIGLLIDAGANSECRAQNLLHFATMGTIYTEKVFNIVNPRVGLVNMGTEPGKGSKMLKEAYVLLEESKEMGINFIGNIEGRDVPYGICDVMVCDGMTGNIILKLTEGVGMSFAGLLTRQLNSNVRAKFGAMLILDKLKEIKKAFDYSEYGGAPVLGIKAPVIKIHGSSNANAVKNGILKAIPFVENKVIENVETSIEKMNSIADIAESEDDEQ